MDHAIPHPGKPPVEQSCQQSRTQSNDQPVAQPNAHGADESEDKPIQSRTADALIGNHATLILDGYTRHALKESKQQPEAQSGEQPVEQPEAQPGAQPVEQPEAQP